MLYSFANIQFNYLDWSNATEQQTAHGDFAYLTLEGGAGWNAAEFYGNFNIENPLQHYADDTPHNLRFTTFGDLDIKLGKDGWRIHFQDFHLSEESFYTNDFVAGISYKYRIHHFWIKPFLGVHRTENTYFNGFNGYMAGWVFDYDFALFGENFSLYQWNEIEFARKEKIYDGHFGLNGDIALYWNITQHLATAVQYRYADHKLGNTTYQSAFIYTLKYSF